MTAFLKQSNRNIVPRWRDFKTTRILGELLSSTINKSEKQATSPELEVLVHEWKLNKSLSFATDLISGAYVIGQFEMAEDAAKYVLDHSRSSAVARDIARLILAGEQNAVGSINSSPVSQKEDFWKVIHTLRLRLIEEPYNAIIRVDMARAYTILGLPEKASSAMNVAIALAPDNRFVLRSATRLFLHIGDVGRAHRLLYRSTATRVDPWLLAAEIAVSSIFERSSKLTKAGLQMLSNGMIPPLHLSELAGTLGTLEFLNGGVKKARKLFSKSLIEPTDNSLAQAVWVKQQDTGLALEDRLFDTPCSFEARASKFYALGEWPEAEAAAIDWYNDQLFSSRAAIHASYVLSIGRERYKDASNILKSALICSPSDPNLLNNLTFALVNDGKTEEAIKYFSQINQEGLPKDLEIAVKATEGLLNFRQGKLEEGRILYERAIEQARRSSDMKRLALAALNYAREEILSSTSRSAAAISAAREACSKVNDPGIAIFQERLKNLPIKIQVKISK